MSKNLDLGGIAVSIGCLLHCVLLPYLITGISVLGIDILQNIYIELSLITAAGIIGFISFYKARKKHRKKNVTVLFFIGFSVLISKIFFSEQDFFLSLIALILIITAHTYNYYLLYKCEKCC